MYPIEMTPVSEDFAACWRAAAQHLQSQVQDAVLRWLKADLNPPFLEHLSFCIGNQNFFVRIEDVEGKLVQPGNSGGVLYVAKGCKGHACLMPMRNDGGRWRPAAPGLGLIDARTGAVVDPFALVSDELIEITDWELHDFAVQVVREDLRSSGRQLMSWVGNPEVDPSIWFIGDNGPEWVIVRSVRYPAMDAMPPRDWDAIAASCRNLGEIGHFASVSVANADDLDRPLWRGHGMVVRYLGLVPGAEAAKR